MSAPRIPRATDRQPEPLAITLPDGEQHLVFPPEASNDDGHEHPADLLMVAIALVVGAWIAVCAFAPGVANGLAAMMLQAMGVGA